MSTGSAVDGVLIQWGDRLFYPGNRIVRTRPSPRLTGPRAKQQADAIRARIQATVVRRAPQVMVKVTGGGRGIKAIAAHFRYISKNGRLDIEDQNGTKVRGRDAVRELAEDWRFGGTLIDDIGYRREAFNIMLSMPRGSADPLIVLNAARDFARMELAEHKYIMVLHDHQANPHVHISARAESKQGKRLNPRKADLQRWRETFADRLQTWGVDAEATRQATCGVNRTYDPLWRIKAREDGRLRTSHSVVGTSKMTGSTRSWAIAAWQEIGRALATSSDPDDRNLARSITTFIHGIERGQPLTGAGKVATVAPTQDTRGLELGR